MKCHQQVKSRKFKLTKNKIQTGIEKAKTIEPAPKMMIQCKKQAFTYIQQNAKLSVDN